MIPTQKNAYDSEEKSVRMTIPQWIFKPDTEEMKKLFESTTRRILGCAVRDEGSLEITVIQERKNPYFAIATAFPNMNVLEYYISPLGDHIENSTGGRCDAYDYDICDSSLVQSTLSLDDDTSGHLILYLNKILVKKKKESKE